MSESLLFQDKNNEKYKNIFNITYSVGGTDIISCFIGCNPTLPVYSGEIQCRLLGMSIEAWNEEGKPVYDKSGELVCTRPFPSMPTHFWNDDSGIKYTKAYFTK